MFGSGALFNYGSKEEQPVHPLRVSQQQRMYNKELISPHVLNNFFFKEVQRGLFIGSWKEGSWIERRPPWTVVHQRHSPLRGL